MRQQRQLDRWLAAATVLAIAPSASLAETSQTVSDAVDEVVVVAEKVERSIRDVAADITVIDDAFLQETLSASIADAMRYVPGVTAESGGSRFGTEGVSIRGIGGNRIALEYDGVPLSEQFDIGNFSNATRDLADAALVGRVEIMRGPASAVYGSAALGGVVAMRSPDPRSILDSRAYGGFASAFYRDADAGAHLQGGVATRIGDGAAVLVSGSHRDGRETDSAAGTADALDYRRSAGLVKIAGDNRYGHGWEFAALRQQSDVNSSLHSVLGAGRFRSTTALDGDDDYVTDLLSASYRFGNRGWFDDAFVRAYHGAVDVEQRTRDERKAATDPVVIEREFRFGQRIDGAEFGLWKDAEAGRWFARTGLGAEWTRRRTEELRSGALTRLADGSVTNTVLGETFPLRDFPVTTTRELGVYLSEELTRGPVTLIAALRYDENRLDPDADAIFLEDNPATVPVSVSDRDLSPKLGAILRVGDDVDVYLQYAQGFRAPPFEDANIGLDIPMFNIRAIPNPDLVSETSEGVEAGLRWRGEAGEFSVAVFRTDYRDFIETKVRLGIDPASGRLLFQSQNIGRASIEGAEARWARRLGGALDGVTLDVAAYYARGENRDTGERLDSVGPAEAVAGVTWRSDDERTAVRAYLRASEGWTRSGDAAGPLFEPPGYALVDLYATRHIGERTALRFAVGNLTDRTWWHWSDVRGLAPDDPLLPALARPGRHYSLGLQWRW